MVETHDAKFAGDIKARDEVRDDAVVRLTDQELLAVVGGFGTSNGPVCW